MRSFAFTDTIGKVAALKLPLEMSTAKRILVIDDDRVIRQSIAAYLQDSGFDVLLADDGLTGLDMFRDHHPDLVICDLRMPGLDGISVLHQISAEDQDTPIVVISGAGVMADVVEALRIGATDYLIKPILDLEVLEHAIHRSLERAKLRRENASYRRKLERANQELQANVAALQKDQQAGRHVQLKMLPAAPQNLLGYEFDHRIIPSLYLSGDFVEYITVGKHHVVFMIADVSGHGASSAFVTVLLKNLTARMRSDFGRHGDDSVLSPAKLLAKANRELLETGLGKHITMFVAALDTRNRQLVYSNAGHLPCPILCQPDQPSEYITGSGMPVGIAADTEFEELQLTLPERFRMYLFTDGILELLSPDDLLDKEAELLKRCDRYDSDLALLSQQLELDAIDAAPDDIALFTVAH